MQVGFRNSHCTETLLLMMLLLLLLVLLLLLLRGSIFWGFWGQSLCDLRWCVHDPQCLHRLGDNCRGVCALRLPLLAFILFSWLCLYILL